MAQKTSIAGKPLVDASYRLLRQDKEMVPLLFAGTVASGVALALIAGIGSLIDPSIQDGTGIGPVAYVFYAVGLLVSASIATFFLGAIVAAATQRANGEEPTPGSALSAAWDRRVPLFAWALLSTVVGLLLQQLERFGPVGAVLRFLGGAAWGVATIFTVPVIMEEGVMPIAAVKRSAQILTQRFGTNVRAGFRLGLQWVVAFVAAGLVLAVGVVVAIAGFSESNVVVGILGVVVAVVGFGAVITVGAVFAAVGAYLRTVLYRHATGRPVPGVDPSALPPLLPA